MARSVQTLERTKLIQVHLHGKVLQDMVSKKSTLQKKKPHTKKNKKQINKITEAWFCEQYVYVNIHPQT